MNNPEGGRNPMAEMPERKIDLHPEDFEASEFLKANAEKIKDGTIKVFQFDVPEVIELDDVDLNPENFEASEFPKANADKIKNGTIKVSKLNVSSDTDPDDKKAA